MSEKIEGTVVLDGMLEGRISETAGTQAKLVDWNRFAAAAGRRFNLEFDGSHFSLLAENAPGPVGALKGPPAEIITRTLNELLKALPLDERRGLFSTIRSLEYRKHLEVQTLYAVGPDGLITSRERTVQAKTTAGPERLTLRQKLALGGIGLGIALALFIVSALFVDYRAIFGHVVEGIRPIDAKELRVETERFKKYFTVTNQEVASGGQALVVTLKRTDAFPRSDADVERLAESEKSLLARLAVEALATGWVRVECYDKEDQLLSLSFLKISELRQKETAKLRVLLPTDHRPARIVITS